MVPWDEWKDRWGKFLTIVIDPWTVVLVAAGFFLSVVLIEQKDRATAAVLTLMVSILSGVLGSIWTNRWGELTAQRVVVARGNAAVRSLKLLFAGIAALERRAREYLQRHVDREEVEPVHGEVVKTYLEEVIERCGILEEETLSSIENWTDIVPEADVRTQIGLISELREEVGRRAKDLEQLKKNLEEVKGRSEEAAAKFKEQIAAKEQELLKLRKELSERRSTIAPLFGTGVSPDAPVVLSPGISVSSLGINLPTPIFASPGKKRCRKCNAEIDSDPSQVNIVCPYCGELMV
jgi:hypothetical protein